MQVAQVASHTLGQLLGAPLPLDTFRFADTNSLVVPNMGMTGGSTTSGAWCAWPPSSFPRALVRLSLAVA